MDGRITSRLGPVLALVAVAVASSAAAGGMGHGGVRLSMGGGLRVGAPAFHGVQGGAAPRWSARGVPPLAGIIHERPGMRSYVSGFGHTNTAARWAGSAGAFRYGHTATALPAWRRGNRFAYGARGLYGYGVGGLLGYGVGGYAGYGVGYGGYGAAGTGSGPGSYGTVATQASPYGGPYVSEVPLAASFAEPPLAPSPGAPYDPSDAYAYAASADSGPGPRIIPVARRARGGCDCGGHVEPVVYRYGVGTAY